MSFAVIVDRVRSEFLEMPGLELTMPQAVRLWNLGLDDCRGVVDSLVDAGFLRWTAKRTIIWTGRDSGLSRSTADARTVAVRGAYVSVGRARDGVNPVG
jgi:hypothetical protein